VPGERSVEVPFGSRRTVVTFERAAAGAGVFAQLNVVDTCGQWKTFVGRGAAP
jgi:hypothetical protein